MDKECDGSVPSNRQPNMPFPSSGRHTTSLAPSTAELNAASVASLAASKASLKPDGACGLSFTLKCATVDKSKGSLPESRRPRPAGCGRKRRLSAPPDAKVRAHSRKQGMSPSDRRRRQRWGHTSPRPCTFGKQGATTSRRSAIRICNCPGNRAGPCSSCHRPRTAWLVACASTSCRQHALRRVAS